MNILMVLPKWNIFFIENVWSIDVVLNEFFSVTGLSFYFCFSTSPSQLQEVTLDQDVSTFQSKLPFTILFMYFNFEIR